MLSMESRMRGDMQVRFGGRYEAVSYTHLPKVRQGNGRNIPITRDIPIYFTT